MKRGRFLQSLLAAAAAPPPAGSQSPAAAPRARRRRRICVQYDAADHRNVRLAPDEWLNRYLFTFADQPGSQIDTIFWDVSLGDTYAVYPSRLLPPSPDHHLAAWRAQGFDWVPAMLAACRRRKLEVFWHHRFSEVDIRPEGGLEMDTLSPLKAEHPDWVIRSWWWQGLWNAASPGLRAHKVEVLREVAETLDVDGIQIDFARHIPCLPPGRQWELRGHVTEFLRMMRRMLNEVGRRRGRNLQLAAKVPETLRGCRADGFDIAVWSKENLVDLLTLGSRTMTVDVEQIRQAVGPRIKLSPCLDDHHATDGYRSPPIEFFRGVATNWLEQGADSVTTFNWAAAPAETARPVGGRIAPDSQGVAYREIGELATMRRKNKLFFVERRGGYPWAEGYHGRNDFLPLPARLFNHGRPSLFPLRVYETDVPRALLSVVLFQARPADRLEVAFNGKVLSGDGPAQDWKDPQIFSPKPQPNSGGSGVYPVDPGQKLLRLSYAVQPSLVRRGENRVSIRVLDRPSYRIGEDIQVEKIELAVDYPA